MTKHARTASFVILAFFGLAAASGAAEGELHLVCDMVPAPGTSGIARSTMEIEGNLQEVRYSENGPNGTGSRVYPSVRGKDEYWKPEITDSNVKLCRKAVWHLLPGMHGCLEIDRKTQAARDVVYGGKETLLMTGKCRARK